MSMSQEHLQSSSADYEIPMLHNPQSMNSMQSEPWVSFPFSWPYFQRLVGACRFNIVCQYIFQSSCGFFWSCVSQSVGRSVRRSVRIKCPLSNSSCFHPIFTKLGQMMSRSSSNVGHAGSKLGHGVTKCVLNIQHGVRSLIQVDFIRSSPNLVRCYIQMMSRSSSNIGHAGSKTRSRGH